LYNNKFHNLSQLHQNLYQTALEEAKTYLSTKSPQIADYADRFKMWLPDSFKSTERNTLHEACIESDHILFGDFHTLRQSQRALSRLIYQIRNYYPERGICLALECFHSEHQQILDKYLDGHISEEQFLTKIDYDSSWGFPWPHYRRLLLTCQNLGIKVFAINSNYERNSLKNRDEHAAKILESIRNDHPDHSIFTLIGENHLADEHLPYSIKRLAGEKNSPEILRVVTNVDKYYFALRDNQKTHGSEYLDLGPKTYCIINTPPWIKWKSFTMWEELRGIVDTIDDNDIDHDEIDDEDDLYTEITFDVDSNFLNVAKELLRFLNIEIDHAMKRKLENFETVFLNDLDEVMKRRSINFSIEVEREIFEKCEKEGVVYIPENKLVIISDLNSNHIAEAAGQHVFCITNPAPENLTTREMLIYESLQHASGLFAAKIFNPKRGFMILANYQNFLNLNMRKNLKGRAREKKILSKAVIKFNKDFSLNKEFYLTQSQLLADKVTFGGLSRAIGQIIGYNLFCQALEQDQNNFALKSILTIKILSKEDLKAMFSNLWNLTQDSHKLLKIS
jgi:hypothetical protein